MLDVPKQPCSVDMPNHHPDDVVEEAAPQPSQLHQIDDTSETIFIKSVAEFNCENLVLPDGVGCRQIKQKYARSVEISPWNGMPTMDRIYSESPILRALGQLNEIEYSSNAKFKNTLICVHDEQNARVQSMVRYYFEMFETVYVNTSNSRIMNKCNDLDADVPIPCSIVMRIDYDPRDGVTARPTQVTAKLKVIKRRFNYADSTFKLSGSIEVPVYSIDATRASLCDYTNCRHIYYWYCFVNGVKYRVAFRENLMQTGKSEGQYTNYILNIECEDETVDPLDFVIVYNLLFKYYKAQYMATDGVIKPEWYNHPSISDLTDYQQHLLKTLKFSNEPSSPDHKIADDSSVIPQIVVTSSESTTSCGNVFYDVPMKHIDVFVAQFATSCFNHKRFTLDGADCTATILSSPGSPPMELDDDDCFIEMDPENSVVTDGDNSLESSADPMAMDEFFRKNRDGNYSKLDVAGCVDYDDGAK